MSSLYIIAEFLSITIIVAEMLCCNTFFGIFLTRRMILSKPLIEKIAEMILLIISSLTISHLIPVILIKSVFLIIAYFVIIQMFYMGNTARKLLISACVYILMLTIDLVSAEIINLFVHLPLNRIQEVPLYFFLAATFSKTFFFLIVILIKKVVLSQGSSASKKITKYYWFVHIFQGFVSMISLLSLIELTYRINSVPLLALLATLGLLYLNTAIYGLLAKSAKYDYIEYENSLYQQQVETNLKNIQVLTKSFLSQRIFLHDYDKNLSILYHLVDNECYDTIKELINSISSDIYVSLYKFKTNHDIIDAILNQKYIEATNKDITLDIRAGDLSNISMEPRHLITLITNAIDNAIEACNKVHSRRVVKIKLLIEGNIFIVSIINPVASPVKIVKNIITTTKTNKLYHGIGLKSIGTVLEQYNGDYELGYKDGFFQFTAFIRKFNNLNL